MHADSRLARRRRHQGGAARPRRHHARPAAGHPRRRQPLLHDAQLQQAQHHAQHQDARRQGDLRKADRALRRAGREFRARRARPPRLHVGEDPRDQPAHLVRVDQGLRPRQVRGFQSLRDRRAGDGRRDEHDRLAGRPADQLRPADRRLGQRHPHGRGDSGGALPAHAHRSRPARLGRDARRGAEPRSREDARSAAARARAAARVPEQDVFRLRAAVGERVGRRPAGGGAQVRAGRTERLRLRDHPAAGLGAAREADRAPGARRRSGLRDAGGAAAAPRRSVRRRSKRGRRASPSSRCSRSSTRSTCRAARS